MDYNLNFISKENFEKHVTETLKQYNKTLSSINLKAFNSNVVDPIKLLFDKNVFDKSYEEIIGLEIHRQRDKSNTNIIGYFHQNMFQYIAKCEVPKHGWDVIFNGENNKYYVEMKNKHNTMNSSSSGKTFMRMQNHLLNSSDKEVSVCALVEVIAKKSQDIPWVITLDGKKQQSNERLRRISIDKFYEVVTGDKFAFRDICLQLPKTIESLIATNRALKVEEDTVFEELNQLESNTLLALYKLAFETYEGFNFKN
ncbi:Eco47II family restriction endonuclease [Pasteurella testudinis]|uniref:Eco47II family restriction endonuclease n=1 Tax=Pasteurella testudinis TaxID=761 RepID=UPI004059C163